VPGEDKEQSEIKEKIGRCPAKKKRPVKRNACGSAGGKRPRKNQFAFQVEQTYDSGFRDISQDQFSIGNDEILSMFWRINRNDTRGGDKVEVHCLGIDGGAGDCRDSFNHVSVCGYLQRGF
jgi:hypothetical protein